MKNITDLIKGLFKVSKEVPKGWKAMLDKTRRMDDLMKELEQESKEQDTLLGGIVRFPMADSYAVYVVTKVNKNTVKLEWLDYCDGWVDDRCGKECNANIVYVYNHINGRRKLAEMFGG